MGIAEEAYLAEKQYQKVKYLEVRFGTGQSRLDPLEVGRDGGGRKSRRERRRFYIPRFRLQDEGKAKRGTSEQPRKNRAVASM